MGKIQSLMFCNFIVITTREGAIGLDFKGTSVSHVVIAFEYSSYTELKQALGRGSRDMNQRCSGTLITDREIFCPVESLIELEKTDDHRKAENLKRIENMAKYLHGKEMNPA